MPDRAKNFFVNNVVLLDEFDHFGQTFDDINVNIDSLTFDRSYEGCRNTNFQPSNQKFWLKLANSYPFLSRCCSQSLFNYKNVCEEEIGNSDDL
jgi:hypothetical protein